MFRWLNFLICNCCAPKSSYSFSSSDPILLSLETRFLFALQKVESGGCPECMVILSHPSLSPQLIPLLPRIPKSPAICQLSVGDDSGLLFLKSGPIICNLQWCIDRREEISIGCVSFVISSIAASAIFLESYGLVPKILSSHNVLITAENRVALLPISLVQRGSLYHLDQVSKSSLLRWIAPEVLLQRVAADSSSSVYSIAIIALQLLRSKDPISDFKDPLQYAVADWRLELDKVKAGIPRASFDILRGSLSQDPSERYAGPLSLTCN